MSGLLNITGLYEPQEVAMNVGEINSNFIYFKTDTEGNFDSVNSNITYLTTDLDKHKLKMYTNIDSIYLDITNLNNFKIGTNNNFDSVNSDITDLTTDLNEFKIGTNNNFDSVNSDITGLNTTFTNFETQANDNFISINNSLTDLSNDIISLDKSTSNNFELTNDYIDAKHQEGKDYTDTEVENLRNEGLIQEAITQVLAWITSDEGKRFRKKIWDKISNKWATFTGSRPYTELLDDVQQASADILDDLMKVYRYDLNNAGIRTDPFLGKDIVMKGDTYIYDGNLHLTGDIYKGTFNSASGSWTQNMKLNDYLVLKGVKTNHCLDINTTTELLELLYDDLDFELGPAPNYKLKLKYPIHSVHPTQCISVDETTKQLEFNVNTDYFEFETNTKKTLKPKFLCSGIDTGTPLSLNSSKLKLDYDTEYFSINAANKLSPLFQSKGITSGNGLSIDATTKLLKFTTNLNQFFVNPSLIIRFHANGGIVDNISGIGNGLQIKLADTSLSLSSLGLQVKADVTYFDIGTSGLQPKFLCTGIDTGTPLSLNSSKLKLDYDTEYFSINAANKLSPLFQSKGITSGNGLSIDATNKLLKFTTNANQFLTNQDLLIRFHANGGIVDNISGIGNGLQIKLADTSLSLSASGLQVKADVTYFDIGTSGLQPKFLCSGIDTGTPLSLNSSKLKLDYDTEYFSINAANKLSPLFELKGLKTTTNPLKVDATTKLLEFAYNPLHFGLDGTSRLSFRFKTDGGLVQNTAGSAIKLADTSLSLSTSGLQINIDQGLMTSVNGVAIKLADTSLDVSSLGLQISSTYKSELQQIKTDTETFKTQAQTAKTAAETAKTAAETAKTQATTQATTATSQATTATSQATIATTQATTATTQAGIATTQAGIATTQAGIATASATSATASAGAATGAATAAAASAAAAAFSATFFQKGDKGDKGDTGPQGPAGDPRLTENPFYIQDNTIKLKKNDTLSISALTGNLEVVGSNITGLNWNNITLNRPSTFPVDLSSVYTKSESDLLLNDKQSNLTFLSPLVNTNNNISLSTTNLITTSGGQTISAGLTVSQGFITYDYIYEGNDYLYNKYQSKLTPSTLLLGDGSGITNIEYSNIMNVPPASGGTSSLTFVSPLIRNADEISIDLTSYLKSSVALSIFATISDLSSKEAILTFNSPLTRTANTIGINLSSYLTTASASSTYLTQANASSTYLTKTSASSTYLTQANASSTYLTAADASSTYLTQANASSTYATISSLSNKENVLTFMPPFLRTGDIIDLDLGSGTFLPLTGGTLTDKLSIIVSGSSFGGLPTANINGAGDRIIFKEGAYNVYPFAIGIATSFSLWFSVPSGIAHQFYINGASILKIANNAITASVEIIGTTISANTFNEGGTNLSSKYLRLIGGTLTGVLTGTTINATTFNEGGTALGSKYLSLSGGNLTGVLTCTDGFGVLGLTTDTQTISFRGNDYNISVNGTTNTHSTWAAQNDMTIRTLTGTKLIFQSGTGAGAMCINSANNVGIGTNSPNNLLDLYSATQTQPRILLSGKEYFEGTNTSTNGVVMLLGANRTNNKQLWIADSERLSTTSTTNPSIRMILGSTNATIDCMATNGSTKLNLQIGANLVHLGSGNIQINNSAKLIFNDVIDDTRLQLYTGYGFGINSSTLRYNSAGSHTFYNGPTINATLTASGNLGIGVTNPRARLDVYNKAMIVRGISEADTATIFLGTPFDTASALKCAIIAQGVSSWSRSTLNFCLNNVANNADTTNATLANARMTIDYNGNVGINNGSPLNDGGSLTHLCIGSSAIDGSDGALVIGKKSGGNTRQFKMGYNSIFYYGLGDYGLNNTVGTWVQHISVVYNAPASCFTIDSLGKVTGNFINLSDERIKTDINTIENALYKVQQLRGVEYTIIQENTREIGLIAQEVEHIIPEAVKENELTGMKGINYNGLIGLLVNAIKEQQQQITEMKQQINFLLNK